MSDNHKQAYVEWVTGLDTEPPLEGAFNAGWHARDVEVERLRALLKARGPYCAQHGELQPCSQHNWGRTRSDYVEQD